MKREIMNKIEDKAYKKYPISVKPLGNGYVEDVNMGAREGYIKGWIDALKEVKNG